MAYTKDELASLVVRAAEELYAENQEKPKTSQVRNIIGSGSLSTISPVLSEWWEKKQKHIALSGAIQAPSCLEDLFAHFHNQLWAMAISEASGLFQHQRQSLERDLANLKSEFEAMRKEANDLEQQNLQLKSINESLKKAIDANLTSRRHPNKDDEEN